MITPPPVPLPLHTDVLLVIDSEGIQKKYTSPSQNPDEPTLLDNSCYYLITPRNQIGTPDNHLKSLSIAGRRNDSLAFYAITIDGDAGDSVILYQVAQKIAPLGIPPVFDFFHPVVEALQYAVQADPEQENGLPPLARQMNFSKVNTVVKFPGRTTIMVFIAVYLLGTDGQTQNLFGYFCFNLPVRIFIRRG